MNWRNEMHRTSHLRNTLRYRVMAELLLSVAVFATGRDAAAQTATQLSLSTAQSSFVALGEGDTDRADGRWFSADPVVAGGPAETEDVQDESAATLSPPNMHDGWQFTLAPYFWASSIRSEVEGGAISATTETCFSDLIKDLNFGAQLRFEGFRDNRWGFYLDGTYLRLESDTTARVGPFRVRGIDIETDFTQAYLDFGGMYRFGKPGRTFDVLVGGRYTYISTEVSVGSLIEFDDSVDAVAPMIGGRLVWDMNDKWLVSLMGDVGGFGVGDSADLILGFTGLLGYNLNDHTMLALGYRYYGFDLENDGYDAEVHYHGPVVGVAFRF